MKILSKLTVTFLLLINLTYAGEQQVNTTADSGAGSLRQAIADAVEGDSITFNLSTPAKITLTSGAIILNKSIIITGSSNPEDIVIDGNSVTSIFIQSSSGNDDTITISGISLSNSGSSAFYQDASSAGNEFTISNCLFINNSSLGNGGAILAAGSSTNILIDCSFVSNKTVVAKMDGGAIENQGYLKIYGCTFTGNNSADDGGAIVTDDENSLGSVDIINSTFSGNTANDIGAAIYIKQATNGIVNIYNSTIVNNSGVGGVVNKKRGFLNIYSSILANNTPGDLSGTVDIAYNCLIGKSSGVEITDSRDNILDQLPLVGPLADNGGPTFTHSITNALSPCLDTGTNILALIYDQRGFPFERVEGPGIDIGSYELIPEPAILLWLTIFLAGCHFHRKF